MAQTAVIRSVTLLIEAFRPQFDVGMGSPACMPGIGAELYLPGHLLTLPACLAPDNATLVQAGSGMMPLLRQSRGRGQVRCRRSPKQHPDRQLGNLWAIKSLAWAQSQGTEAVSQNSQEPEGAGGQQVPAQERSGKSPGVSAKSPKESQKSPAGQLVRNRVEFNPLL